MSVVNAASVQSAVAVMVGAVVVVVAVEAVNAPKAAMSALASAVLSEAKVALIHVANAALKVVLRAVLNALQPKAVVMAAAKVVAMRNDPVRLVQTCAAKAVVTAPAVIVQNAQSALTVVNVALNAVAHPAMQPKKNWHSPIRRPWLPLHAAK
jgi:hypothetical protein